MATDVLLNVKNLRVSFRTEEGQVTAVDGVDFAVRRGETLGIVGESGSGKSVSTRALVTLLPRKTAVDWGEWAKGKLFAARIIRRFGA